MLLPFCRNLCDFPAVRLLQTGIHFCIQKCSILRAPGTEGAWVSSRRTVLTAGLTVAGLVSGWLRRTTDWEKKGQLRCCEGLCHWFVSWEIILRGFSRVRG